MNRIQAGSSPQLAAEAEPQPQPEQARSPRPTPVSKSLAANRLEQFAPQAPVRSGPSAKESLRRSLEGGFFGRVGEQDLAQVHQALEALNPSEFAATLASLDREGLLAKYLGKLEPAARDAFLAQGLRNGYLTQVPGSPGGGALNAPSSPATLRNDPKLPAAVREAVYSSARDQALTYCQAFRAYQGRYEEAVKQARSGAQLRALGEPTRPQVPGDGMNFGHPDAQKNRGQWLAARDYPSLAGTQKLISDKLSDLIGEGRVGALSLEGRLSVKAGSAMAKLKGEVDGRGRVSGSGEAGLQEGLGPLTLGAAVDTKGRLKVSETVGIGGLEVQRTRSSDGTVRHEASAAGAGLIFDGKGRAEVSIGKGYAFADPGRGQFGAGLSTKTKLAGAEVKLSAGVTFQTLTREAALHALAQGNPGAFATPPALAAGTSWEALSDTERALHRRNGWTAEEWASRLSGRR